MYKKILVAFGQSQSSYRALERAVQLAGRLKVDLHAIAIQPRLPWYDSYASAVSPEAIRNLKSDQREFYDQLIKKAEEEAKSAGIQLKTRLFAEHPVENVVQAVQTLQADLLIFGYHSEEIKDHFVHSAQFKVSEQVNCDLLIVH